MFKDTLRKEGRIVLDDWKPLTVRCTKDNVRVELNRDTIKGGWTLTTEHIKVRSFWAPQVHCFYDHGFYFLLPHATFEADKLIHTYIHTYIHTHTHTHEIDTHKLRSHQTDLTG